MRSAPVVVPSTERRTLPQLGLFEQAMRAAAQSDAPVAPPALRANAPGEAWTVPATEATTSREAADTVAVETVHRRRAQVLAALRARPMALWELADTLRVPPHWLTSTLVYLLDAGQVVKSRDRTINPHSGKAGRVWQVAA